MTKLSPNVYMYHPPTTTPAPASSSNSNTTAPPKLVVLLTWMGAREAHIAKYVRPYQALFPSSPILLVRSEPMQFLVPGGGLAEAATAKTALQSVLPPTDTKTDTPPEVLVHAWSNGGSKVLFQLRSAVGAASFPRHTVVLDSAPGQLTYHGAIAAFAAGLTGLTRWAVLPILHVLSGLFVAWKALFGRVAPEALARVFAAHNGAQWRAAEVRRTYIYSDVDALVDSRHVEQHIADAEKAGFDVRVEKFEGTPHVAHVRGGEDRYWRAVKETWEGVA
ncbi:hypothetical protein B0T26DRAFT_657043 [Lasiosphaeria miniovina]|uniref:Indole-diterpene biosynthesis protein PaxU n=1 Tax=Lasiosphaeria miniovina TaxID=1954250 RepID=A0AA39ZYU7_9PEZI|nr:uncharacterized protein B0T26DRAFT_657043 [Lasiosphaeria miniovina]KAK0706171.1 hypothetical protein B0T26DRAFT_657043 [Lasiosphaeria miniovina]